MKKTKVDFFGRATNGYGDDVKTFMSKKLNLPIELFTDAMCQYIETNYYAWWYYEVVGLVLKTAYMMILQTMRAVYLLHMVMMNFKKFVMKMILNIKNKLSVIQPAVFI